MNAAFNQLEVETVCQAYRKSRQRIILLDFGGTIVSEENFNVKFKGNSKSPVMMPKEVKNILTDLCKISQNTVFIISGKERIPLESAAGKVVLFSIH